MSEKILVIGAGQAAIAFAAKLRELDNDCEITLIGDEPSLPYQRPPLSKQYMNGEMTADRLMLRPSDWYAENNVTCLHDRHVDRIDVENMQIVMGEKTLPFDKMLIATGARPRELPEIIGGELKGVHVLRNLADADAIAPKIKKDKTVLIVGGGYIGLEAAAVCATKGMKVHVVEMSNRILKRVASRETSEFVREKHRSHGVDIREETRIDRLEGSNSHVKKALLSDGSSLDVDLVIVGIGVQPNQELALDAGIDCNNGIEVDDFGLTSYPNIYAAGDVASFEFRGSHIRLESVQNAIDQAEHAARVMAGSNEPYRPVPWFWSDQYDMKLQIAGLNIGYDETVIRPGSHEGGQSVWYFAAGNFIAVDAINDAKAYMIGKKVLELGKSITPEQAADPDFNLKDLIRG